MRSIAVLVSAAAALLSAAPGSADEDYTRSGLYVAVGGSLGFALSGTEDDLHDGASDLFRRMENGAFSDAVLRRVDANDSIGANGRIGYRLNRYFSLEAQLEYLDRFQDKRVSLGAPLDFTDAFDPSSPQAEDADEFAVVKPEDVAHVERTDTTTVTANAKVHFPIGVLQPFVLMGAGWTTTDSKVRIDFVGKDTVSAPNANPPDPAKPSVPFSASDSERFRDFAMRFGGGFDLYLTEHFALSLGFDYVLPFGEAEPFDYTSFTWGLLYRF